MLRVPLGRSVARRDPRPNFVRSGRFLPRNGGSARVGRRVFVDERASRNPFERQRLRVASKVGSGVFSSFEDNEAQKTLDEETAREAGVGAAFGASGELDDEDEEDDESNEDDAASTGKEDKSDDEDEAEKEK